MSGRIEYEELRDFDKKELRLKTVYMVDSELADQKLPKELRLWTDADYQKRQSPHPSRLKTESDGFMGKSIPQKKMMSKRTLSDTK